MFAPRHGSRPDSDDNGAAAARLGASEFELFGLAYQHWFGRPAEPALLKRHFDSYLRSRLTPHWVRDYRRKVLRGDFDPVVADRPASRTALGGWLIGAAALSAVTATVAGVVYLAVQSQQAAPLACLLPPCY